MGKEEQQEEATPEQKRHFEEKKAKQMDKDQPAFNPDSDEDTTGKSEAFDEKKVSGHEN